MPPGRDNASLTGSSDLQPSQCCSSSLLLLEATLMVATAGCGSPEYRGRVVLLDFWMINYGWCQVGIPRMVEAYRKLHGMGVEIIGVNGEDAEGTLRPFIAEKNMTWSQTIQDKDDGPIHKLYRVGGFPAYYLIGRDGKLASRRLEGGAEDELLAWAERLASATQQTPPGR